MTQTFSPLPAMPNKHVYGFGGLAKFPDSSLKVVFAGDYDGELKTDMLDLNTMTWLPGRERTHFIFLY